MIGATTDMRLALWGIRHGKRSWFVSAGRSRAAEAFAPVARPTDNSGGAPMANSHILVGATTSPAQPVVRRISTADVHYALRRGVDDFTAVPSHAVFLCVIYPLLGILLI